MLPRIKTGFERILSLHKSGDHDAAIFILNYFSGNITHYARLISRNGNVDEDAKNQLITVLLEAIRKFSWGDGDS